jgi:hypothetical protein
MPAGAGAIRRQVWYRRSSSCSTPERALGVDAPRAKHPARAWKELSAIGLALPEILLRERVDLGRWACRL